MVYLNNAATTFPKPPAVLEAVAQQLARPPRDAGRGLGEGEDELLGCRKAVARLLGEADYRRVLLTPGATFSLNLALMGLLGEEPGRWHCVTSCLEHNSVLRPLWELKRRGMGLTVLGLESALDPAAWKKAVRPKTRALVTTAASNVLGIAPPLEELTELCLQRELFLVIDAAQAAGTLLLHTEKLPERTLIGFAGHKGLYGPEGTGALYLGTGVTFEELAPLLYGGTGVVSTSQIQPLLMPHRYEAGTPNAPGFAGLRAGVEFVLEQGVADLGQQRARLTAMLREKLERIKKVTLYGYPKSGLQAGVVAFTAQGWDSTELADMLREIFGIHVRGGLHCAPLIHKYIGAPRGTLRASFGWQNTEQDVQALVRAIRALVRGKVT